MFSKITESLGLFVCLTVGSYLASQPLVQIGSVGRGSAFGIATAYELGEGGVGVRVLARSRIFTSSYNPDRLWGPPSLLSKEYRRIFPAK
jgi:hypothetical protein